MRRMPITPVIAVESLRPGIPVYRPAPSLATTCTKSAASIRVTSASKDVTVPEDLPDCLSTSLVSRWMCVRVSTDISNCRSNRLPYCSSSFPQNQRSTYADLMRSIIDVAALVGRPVAPRRKCVPSSAKRDASAKLVS